MLGKLRQTFLETSFQLNEISSKSVSTKIFSPLKKQTETKKLTQFIFRKIQFRETATAADELLYLHSYSVIDRSLVGLDFHFQTPDHFIFFDSKRSSQKTSLGKKITGVRLFLSLQVVTRRKLRSFFGSDFGFGFGSGEVRSARSGHQWLSVDHLVLQGLVQRHLRVVLVVVAPVETNCSRELSS